MQRFRRTWLALIAGTFLVTLSVSTALGAAPSGTRDATRGQAIAAAVHEIIFGSDETEEPNEEPVEEEELIDEELDEEELDEEPIEDEELDEEESDAHGACVSAAAQDREGSAESQLKNHGKWVSQHARYTCWGLDVPTDETDEEATEEDEASEVGTASDDTDADDDGRKADKADKADKAERGNGKPSWAGNGHGGNGKPAGAGNSGNGRGGGGRR